MSILKYYFIIINILAFIVCGIDKFKAIRKKRRISEKFMLILSLLGGGVGFLLSMSVFHHKISKSSFLIKFFSILLGWTIVIFLIYNNIY